MYSVAFVFWLVSFGESESLDADGCNASLKKARLTTVFASSGA
jgi:hypothetical protein